MRARKGAQDGVQRARQRRLLAIGTLAAIALGLVVALFSSGPLRTWLVAAVVAGAAAVVAGAVARSVSTAGSSLWQKASGYQPIRVTRHPSLVRHSRSPSRALGYLLPGPSDLPQGPQPTGGAEERDRWVRRPGVVDAGWTNLQLLIEGSSDAAVVLVDLTIQVHERRPPPEAALIPPVGGGAVAVRYFVADLDSSPPVVRFEPGDEPSGPPIDFPYDVSKAGPEVFFLKAETRDWDCLWTAELHWISGGERGVTVIDDDSEPFRTAATTNATPYMWADGAWVASPRAGRGG